MIDYLVGDPDRGIAGMASRYTTVNRNAACRTSLELVCDPPTGQENRLLYGGGGGSSDPDPDDPDITITNYVMGASFAPLPNYELLEELWMVGGVRHQFLYTLAESGQVRPMVPPANDAGWSTVPVLNPIIPDVPQDGNLLYGFRFETPTGDPFAPYFERWEIGVPGITSSGQSILWYVDPNTDTVASLDGGNTWSITGFTFTKSITLAATSGRYGTPMTDDAPWFDTAVPASADFGGLYVEEMTGFDGLVNRDVADGALRGGSLGLLRMKARSMTVTGWLRSRTCAGAEYGLGWLTEALLGESDCNDCDLGDLFMLKACPPEGSAPDAVDYVRFMHRVGLTDGPKVVDRVGTCCGDCGATNLKVQFTLVSESPYIFSDAEWAAFEEPFDLGPFEYDLSLPCLDGNCPEVAPPWTPSCLPDFTPPPPPFAGADGCYCEPWTTMRRCMSFSNDHDWNEVTTIIEVMAGSAGLRNMKLMAFKNPLAGQGQACPCEYETDELWRCAVPCATLTIPEMPPNGRMVIDSRLRTVELHMPGGEVLSAMRFVGSALDGEPFEWFDIGPCTDLCMVASVDFLTPGAAISVGLVNRYLASGG